MMELLYRPREPIESYINIAAYAGWRGKKREKTKENVAQIANDLLSRCKYAKEKVMRQLSNAIRRIDNHQTIARFVTIANYGIPGIAGAITHYPLHDFLQVVAFVIAISPPSILAGRYIYESRRRRILYHEIKYNLEGKIAPTQNKTNVTNLENIAETH